MEEKPKVIIYTAGWCNFCHSMMDWLKKQGVEYEEKSTDDEKINAELMEKLGGNFQGLPVVFIGEDQIQGFDRLKVQSALQKYGLK